jgi:hypothetical protein
VRVVHEEGRVTAQHVACVDAQPVELFQPAAKRFLERELSPEERTAADAFFASPLGRKLHNFVVAAGGSGLPVDLSSLIVELNDEDQTLAQVFLDSSAGDKLLVKSLFRKGTARQEVVAKSREVLQACLRG